MRLLLDTCTFLWIAAGAPELTILAPDPAIGSYLVPTAWRGAAGEAQPLRFTQPKELLFFVA